MCEVWHESVEVGWGGVWCGVVMVVVVAVASCCCVLIGGET